MTKRKQLAEPSFEARYVVHLDSGTILEGDWGEVSDLQFEEMCQALEQFRLMNHFSVVRDGVDLFIHPAKIEYVEVHTKDTIEETK